MRSKLLVLVPLVGLLGAGDARSAHPAYTCDGYPDPVFPESNESWPAGCVEDPEQAQWLREGAIDALEEGLESGLIESGTAPALEEAEVVLWWGANVCPLE